MKDNVTRILENHFIYKKSGRPLDAQNCLNTAKVFCKDNFDKRYEEVKQDMERRMTT